MKFSDYYLSSASRAVATFLGLLVGGVTGLFAGWQYGVLVGAGTALVASVAVPLRVWLAERPYNRIKETLTGPFLIDQRVRFSVRGGTVSGYFILTQDSMIFLSMENGEHRLEFSRGDVRSVVVGKDMSIRVFLDDRQFIRVISNLFEEICEVLRENGWQVRTE